MRRSLLFLSLALAPAPVLGQDACPEGACHFAPYYRGTGGFVGERNPAWVDEDGAPLPVRLAVVCGPVTVSGEVEPDADGIVRQVLNRRNALACDGDGGFFEVRGLLDGGWYWVHDDPNSAVQSLFRLEVRGNAKTQPLDPGGVVMTTVRGAAAVFVKHPPSGRVGILPQILPAPDMPGCEGEAVAGEPCLLGSSDDWDLVLTTDAGDRAVGAEAIERGADVAVKVTLMGRGYVRTGTVEADVELSGGYRGTSPLRIPAGVTVTGTPAAPVEGGELAWTVLVPVDPDRCAETSGDRFVEQTVLVSATGALTGALPAWEAGKGPSASFTITCPDG